LRLATFGANDGRYEFTALRPLVASTDRMPKVGVQEKAKSVLSQFPILQIAVATANTLAVHQVVEVEKAGKSTTTAYLSVQTAAAMVLTP